MSYKLFIFDMDGTILNTLEDLTDSLNYALAYHGMPKRSINEVRSFVGNGIKKLVERGVADGTSEAEIDKVLATFTEHYKIHCSDKTAPYEGILETLKSIKASGGTLAVVSNKADFAVRELCEQYFCGIFDVAVGESASINKKPAPDMVELVLNELGISPSQAVYIGDSEVDIQTAKNAGLDCIAVSWGFRTKEQLVACGATKIVPDIAQMMLALGL